MRDYAEDLKMRGSLNEFANALLDFTSRETNPQELPDGDLHYVADSMLIMSGLIYDYIGVNPELASVMKTAAENEVKIGGNDDVQPQGTDK